MAADVGRVTNLTPPGSEVRTLRDGHGGGDGGDGGGDPQEERPGGGDQHRDQHGGGAVQVEFI
jgi:hypothetical protein